MDPFSEIKEYLPRNILSPFHSNFEALVGSFTNTAWYVEFDNVPFTRFE